MERRPLGALVVASACALGLAAGPGAGPAAAQGGSLAGDLVPRPGPDLLYAEPPRAPQLENTGIWKAAPLLVSGATAYRDGEFLYQDFLFDDHGARLQADPEDDRARSQTFSAPNGTYTYPTDRRYASNAADLVEVRVRPLADATAFRLTFNSLTDPALVGTTIALGSSPAPLPAPYGANMQLPAEVFVTVHGGAADALAAGTDAPLPAPSVAVDLERRQVEVRVPHTAWNPAGQTRRIAVGTGLWDAAANRYLLPRSARSATVPGGAGTNPAPPAFFNVAFRTAEPQPQITDAGQPFSAPRWWRDAAQASALGDGVLTEHAAEVDFAKLAAGVTDEAGLPRTGALNRILASRFEPSQGLDVKKICGGPDTCTGLLQSRLQPYAVYVPNRPPPAAGYGLTLLLHSLGANYNQFSASRNQSQLGERTSGHIVITPSGRGPDGWYYDLAGADTFEVWNDVARHYPLDPGRAAVTGYSMGGYGAYKLATQWPDLFGAANTVVGPPTLGVSSRGTDSTGGPQTSTLPQLESVRHVPFMIWAGTTDQLVPFSSVAAQAQRFDALGLRYVFDAFTPADHFALAVNDQYGPVAEFLGESPVVRDPARVSLTVNPTMDFPAVQTTGGHAYWVSGVRVADPAKVRGTVDVRSQGFGAVEPQPGATARSAGVLTGGSLPGISYARQSKAWGPAGTTAAVNRLVIDAENVSTLTIHPERARVGCDAALDVRTSTTVKIVLAGCDRTVEVKGTAQTCSPPAAFRRLRVTRRRGGLRFAIRRSGRREFTVDVFRQSRGRLVIGERRVARFTGRTRPFTWSGRGTGDGVHMVRVTARTPGARTDVRRLVFVRRNHRFVRGADHDRRDRCGELRTFKLERPVFGGRRNRALSIAFRVRRTSTVRVTVTRAGRTVKRFKARRRSAGTLHRLRLAPERLRRGVHRVTIDVRPAEGGSRKRATLVTRRL